MQHFLFMSYFMLWWTNPSEFWGFHPDINTGTLPWHYRAVHSRVGPEVSQDSGRSWLWRTSQNTVILSVPSFVAWLNTTYLDFAVFFQDLFKWVSLKKEIVVLIFHNRVCITLYLNYFSLQDQLFCLQFQTSKNFLT